MPIISRARRYIWVSGSSETKTYGKSALAREHEEGSTLPRRSLFGKDLDARSRVFNTLHVLLSPPKALFSGKWSCAVIGGWC
jgi:hypothetical protein